MVINNLFNSITDIKINNRPLRKINLQINKTNNVESKLITSSIRNKSNFIKDSEDNIKVFERSNNEDKSIEASTIELNKFRTQNDFRKSQNGNQYT